VPRGKRCQKLKGEVSRDVGEHQTRRKGRVDRAVLSAERRPEEKEVPRHVAGIDREREESGGGEASCAPRSTSDHGGGGEHENEGKGDRKSGGFCQDGEPEASSRQQPSGQVHLSRPCAQGERSEERRVGKECRVSE